MREKISIIRDINNNCLYDDKPRESTLEDNTTEIFSIAGICVYENKNII